MSDQDKFLLYTAPDGAVKVDVFFKEETVWLTQKALAELFAVKVPAINKHLKNSLIRVPVGGLLRVALCAMASVKNIGKPCAGKSHARFDDGGQASACSLLYPFLLASNCSLQAHTTLELRLSFRLIRHIGQG